MADEVQNKKAEGSSNSDLIEKDATRNAASPFIPFPVPITKLSNILPHKKIRSLNKSLKALREKKVNRRQMVYLLLKVVKDDSLLASTVKSHNNELKEAANMKM